MQEVEVPPRDTFAHYVYVDRPQRTLLWWFNTKRHNIGFGLYYLPGRVEGAQIQAELTADDATDSASMVGPDGDMTASERTMQRSNTGGHLTATPVDAPRQPRRRGSTVSSLASSLFGASGSISPPPTPTHASDMLATSAAAAGVAMASMHAVAVTAGRSPATAVVAESPLLGGLPRSHRAQSSTGSLASLVTVTAATHSAVAGTPTHASPLNGGSGGNSHQSTPSTATLSEVSSAISPQTVATGTGRGRQRTSFRPKDPRMQALLPVETCDSSRRTIQGQHWVQEAGTYVFIFDNSFSWNTTKRLTFFVAAKDGLAEPTNKVEYAGWILKKKRKRMQGWAKRWIQVENGVLSYSKYPYNAWRGSVRIALATISTVPQHRTLHIDSGTSTYHMKAITAEDFAQCMEVLRRYKAMPNSAAFSEDGELIEDEEADALAAMPVSGSIGSAANSLRISTLRSRQAALLSSIPPNESGSYTSPIEMEVENVLVMLNASARASLDDASILAGTTRSTPTRGSPHTGNAGNGSARSGNKLRFPFTQNRERRDTGSSTNSESGHITETDTSLVLAGDMLDKLKGSLDVIRRENRQQTDVLREQLQWRAQVEAQLGHYRDEINSLRAKLDMPPLSAENGDLTSALSPTTCSPEQEFIRTLVRRVSTRSNMSHASDVFFDAAEDIIVADDSDSEDSDTASMTEADDSRDEESGESVARRRQSTFQLSDIDNDEDDEDGTCADVDTTVSSAAASTTAAVKAMIDEDISGPVVVGVMSSGQAVLGRRSSMARSSGELLLPQEPVGDALPVSTITETSEPHTFERRTRLPAPTCETEISFLALLRKNIGKDLSTVAMPVALNEPVNLLQKLCEELEYSELLDRASEHEDSLDRLMCLAAFVVSGYASTQYRSTRKPFNPLHGETYECVREDKGFRFLAEKVSHNPPVMACHAISDNFVFHQDSKLKSKFWGKSMELSPSGTVHIELPRWKERYTYCKPATWMRNMLGGNRYLEHSGDVRLDNHTTGEYCMLNFKEGGMFSASTNEVIGSVYNAKGKKVRTLSGRWTEIMVYEREKTQLEVLWRAHPPPSDHERQYGFTEFSVQLNELTPDLCSPGALPITDTRLRPDQRAYENGDVDTADVLKARLEEEQRQRRRQMEADGREWQTQWFDLSSHPHCKEPCWQYRGGYWEAKEQRQFPNPMQLWPAATATTTDA